MFTPEKPNHPHPHTAFNTQLQLHTIERVEKEAARVGISTDEFCRQAVLYALNNMKQES